MKRLFRAFIGVITKNCRRCIHPSGDEDYSGVFRDKVFGK
jgi:hypothetical protein